MKKQIMLLLTAALLPGAERVLAQDSQANDPTVLAGHFEMKAVANGDTSRINVNYALSPAPFSSVLNLELSTPDPLLLKAEVLDADDKTLISWAPSTGNSYYFHGMDISALAAGSYHVNIIKGSDVIYSIPFTK